MIQNTPLVRMAMSVVLYPVMAIVLYGAARLLAMVLVRVIPDGRLKRKLFRDVDTGLLAYKPGVRRKGFLKRRALRRWDA
jgi:hypothetical protein